MKSTLNEYESRLLQKIEQDPSMIYVINTLENFIQSDKSVNNEYIYLFNQISEIINNSYPNHCPQNRYTKNQNRDKILSIFKNLLAYIFIQNKIHQTIKPSLFITLNPNQFKDAITIKVGDIFETLNIDIAIYSIENNTINKCIFFILDTEGNISFFDQCFWKLLMEIATDTNAIKDKYKIEYNPSVIPFVAFATVNFYNEINNPQHRGMFQFFDKSFIAKPIQAPFIEPLSNLVDFVNTHL